MTSSWCRTFVFKEKKIWIPLLCWAARKGRLSFLFFSFSDTVQCRLYLTPPHHPHLSPGLTATSTAHPLLPSGPPALEPHKGALTREKKEPVPLGRDYIPVRFFSPLGRPPLNPPLPWLESEQGKAGWVQKKAPYMCDEVLHCCMK